MQQIGSKLTIIACILSLFLAYGIVLLFGSTYTIDKYAHKLELTEVLGNHFKSIWSSETIADLPDTSTIIYNKTIFLKTHKTGSSTLAGILWRQLCEKERRHCFLPPRSNPGRTWDFGKLTHRQYAMKSTGLADRPAPFDVWLHHVKRHDFLFRTVVNVPQGRAGANVQFLSIVRHPVDRFRSAWTWYSLGATSVAKERSRYSKVKENEPSDLERFVCQQLGGQQRQQDCGPKSHTPTSILSQISVWSEWIMNIFAFQFFWPLPSPPHFKYRTGLDATSEELVGMRSSESGFHGKFLDLLRDVITGKVLLLVCDRFDESLLVLERAVLRLQAKHHEAEAGKHATVGNISEGIRWPQLLYQKQKVQSQIEPLSPTGAQGLLELQPYDHALYKAANAMLDRYLSQLRAERGEDMYENDLNGLIEQNILITELCDEGDSSRKGGSFQDAGLTVTDARQLCASLRRDNAELVSDAWESMRDSKRANISV